MKLSQSMALISALSISLNSYAQNPSAKSTQPTPAPVATTTSSQPVSNVRQGFSFGLPNGGGTTVGYMRSRGNNEELRYDFLFDLNKAGKNIDTTFAFGVQVGLRKYLSESSKIKVYHQPSAFVSKAAKGEFTEALSLGVGYSLGGEFFINPDFSIGARVGLSLTLSNQFKAFRLVSGTSALQATYYW